MSTPKFKPGGDKKEDGGSKKDEKKEEKAEILYDEGRTGPGEKKDVSGPLPDAYRCGHLNFLFPRFD